MTNVKTTKKALLSSVVALLLCFAMLMGTTFAWFTDTATSGTNKIQSGNLKVDIVDVNGASLVGDNLKFQNKNGKTDILWEPGVTFRTQAFQIKNNGNLALKYRLSLNGVTGNAKLLEVITFSIVKADGTAVDLANFEGKLETANALSEVYYIQGAMASSAGNEYQNQTLEGIGITVSATQLAYETDSFDNQYDAGLETSQNGTSRVLSDGSKVLFYSEESGYGGRVRLTEVPETLGSEYVVPAEVNDLGGALVGKTLDKLTIPAGIAYGYKSLEGATIKEVVFEDGAKVIPNRTFYKTNVETVVIPASVTTIEENAFAMATSTTLTIPASVTKIGETAFQHMDNLTTVTIEGNVDIEGYAFRGCDVLSTVNLNGEDVNFVVSATGKNSCWFCNGESNNPGTSHITFNVKNDTVAQKLLTAMGADKTTIQIFVNGTAYQW